MEKFYSKFIKVIIPIILVLIVFTAFLLIKVLKTDSQNEYNAEIPDVSYSKVVATTNKNNEYNLFSLPASQTQVNDTQIQTTDN